MAERISIGVEGTVELSPERIFRYLEYGGSSPSKPILEKLKVLTPMARKLAQPRTLSRICKMGEAVNLHKNDLPTPIQGASFRVLRSWPLVLSQWALLSRRKQKGCVKPGGCSTR